MVQFDVGHREVLEGGLGKRLRLPSKGDRRELSKRKA